MICPVYMYIFPTLCLLSPLGHNSTVLRMEVAASGIFLMVKREFPSYKTSEITSSGLFLMYINAIGLSEPCLNYPRSLEHYNSCILHWSSTDTWQKAPIHNGSLVIAHHFKPSKKGVVLYFLLHYESSFLVCIITILAT